MTDRGGFGEVVAWLLARRGLGAQQAADRAGLTVAEVGAVCTAYSRADLLRRLAPVLGFHAVDLLVLAGLPVPEDLAPLDVEAGKSVESLVTCAVRLPAADRQRLLRRARALPRRRRAAAFPPSRIPIGDGPGGAIIQMLRYRNLGPSGMAKVLAVSTGTYLAASTYNMIGVGRKDLTPSLVTDFAAVLGIDAKVLAVLTGVSPTDVRPGPAPAAAYAAALLREARRLSAAQAAGLAAQARAKYRTGPSGGAVGLPGGRGTG